MSPRTYWYIREPHDSAGPFHAVSPGGREHGPFPGWEEAWRFVFDQEADQQDVQRTARAFEALRLLAHLKTQGVQLVCITYAGAGDEGQIDDVEVDWTLDPEEEELLAEFAEDIVAARFPGWENNEGADGSLTFDLSPAVPRLKHAHSVPVPDTEMTETLLPVLGRRAVPQARIAGELHAGAALLTAEVA
jgi:hypothetical protein